MIQTDFGEREGVRARGLDGLHIQNLKGTRDFEYLETTEQPCSMLTRDLPIMMACEPSEVEQN